MRVLIVEDDPGISSALLLALKGVGYAADVCDSLRDARAALSAEPFDAILLDLGLPDGDGVRLLEHVRNAKGRAAGALPDADTPVLIMTARDGVDARIAGLDHGADDYLVKPFDANELLARMRATLRRCAGRSSPLLVYGDLVIDPAARTVRRDGENIPLGIREFALLQTLVEARPQVLSKPRLEAALYGFGETLDSNAIEVHVHHLRRKLGDQLIKTMRGVGYFVPRDAAA